MKVDSTNKRKKGWWGKKADLPKHHVHIHVIQIEQDGGDVSPSILL